MAFIDDIGKKISQTTQSAVQKTKDMTEIAKINSAISDEEKVVNNLYFKIGKQYAATHSDTFEPEFSEMMNGVKASLDKIEKYRAQIDEIKSVVRCEKCGAQLTENAKFCVKCGAKVEIKPVVNSEVFKCPKCGKELTKDSRFCVECGAQLQPKTEEPAEKQVSPPADKVCSVCGTVSKGEVLFCVECGNKL